MVVKNNVDINMRAKSTMEVVKKEVIQRESAVMPQRTVEGSFIIYQ